MKATQQDIIHTIEKLYGDHKDDLRAFLYSKETETALIDDIIQESFIKLLSSISNHKEIRNPKSWLFRVAQNGLTDYNRAQKKEAQVETALIQDSTESKATHGPEDCLHGIIASLPYKYKRAVYLTDIKGIKQIDAAATLGLTLPTFKSHVQRGRKLVKQGYVDCCDYDLDAQGKLRGETKNWDECKVCH